MATNTKSYKYVNSKAEETAADVQQADISFFNPLGGKYHRFLDLFVAAVLRILILDPLDISTLNQVSFKMFPIGFSTILPSTSSPLSPQGKYDSLLMVDDDKTIRTGGGEGRGPAEILFLITVLLGGWLGVVARLIVARWSDLMFRKLGFHSSAVSKI